MDFGTLIMNLAAVFAFANVALTVILISAYAQSWRRVRSGFTMGLMLFAIFFLTQNLVIIVFWYVLYGLVPVAQSVVLSAAPYLFLINLTETIALGNLTRVSWK
jgi:hypothetical protein